MEAFALVFKSPGLWIAWAVLLLVIGFVLGLIPIAGQLVSSLIGAFWAGGMLIAAHTLATGGRMRFGQLFAGFGKPVGRLLLLSVVMLVGAAAIIAGTVGVMARPLIAVLIESEPDAERLMALLADPTVQIAALLALALLIPLSMAYWFAPALIALQDMPVGAAMAKSFKGCLKNILPFLLYGLVMTVVAVIATIPLALGWLIAFPALFTSSYASFRDVFKAA
jgi:uncharacterized membrane protein